jgi:hypothetical protein
MKDARSLLGIQNVARSISAAMGPRVAKQCVPKRKDEISIYFLFVGQSRGVLHSLSGIDPSAVRAMERLLLRVGSIMPGQMLCLGELLGTYRTHAFLLGRLWSPTAP